jgi:hypothetical protein
VVFSLLLPSAPLLACRRRFQGKLMRNGWDAGAAAALDGLAGWAALDGLAVSAALDGLAVSAASDELVSVGPASAASVYARVLGAWDLSVVLASARASVAPACGTQV